MVGRYPALTPGEEITAQSKREGRRAFFRGRFGRRTKEPDVTTCPTPIRISRCTRTVLTLTVLAVLRYIVYLVPSVLTTAVGG